MIYYMKALAQSLPLLLSSNKSIMSSVGSGADYLGFSQLSTLLAVNLRNSFDFSALQFPHLSNEDQKNFFTGRVAVRIT